MIRGKLVAARRVVAMHPGPGERVLSSCYSLCLDDNWIWKRGEGASQYTDGSFS